MVELSELIHDPGRDEVLKMIDTKIKKRDYLLRLIESDASLSDEKTPNVVKNYELTQSEIDTLIRSIRLGDTVKNRLAIDLLKSKRAVDFYVNKCRLLIAMLSEQQQDKDRDDQTNALEIIDLTERLLTLARHGYGTKRIKH